MFQVNSVETFHSPGLDGVVVPHTPQAGLANSSSSEDTPPRVECQTAIDSHDGERV